MLVRRVIEHQFDDDAQAAFVRRIQEALEVIERAVGRMDA